MGRVRLKGQYQGELDFPLVVVLVLVEVEGEKMTKSRDTRGALIKVLQSR